MPFEALDKALSNMGIQDEKTPDIKPGRCYSAHEIILIAVELEKEGHVFYRYATKIAPTKKMAGLFSEMASDELEHIRVLYKEIEPAINPKEDSRNWESDEAVAQFLYNSLGPGVFPGKKELEKRIKSSKSLRDICDLCIEGEKKSIEFYRSLLSGVDCEQAGKALKKILEEEERHLEKLEKVKDEL